MFYFFIYWFINTLDKYLFLINSHDMRAFIADSAHVLTQ